MTRIFLGALLAGAISFPAMAALKAGDAAPDFKTKATVAGKQFEFSLAAQLKKGPVVVYFYPNAFSQGCEMEAHAFAEHMEKFTAAGATVIGVSTDPIERLNDFSVAENSCAGKVPLAADPDGAISKSFDLTLSDLRAGAKDTRGQDYGKTFYAQRVTFVVTPDSKIVATIPAEGERLGGGAASFAAHAEKSLAVVEQLKAAKH